MTGWTIHADATGPSGTADPDALDELLGLLVDHGGTVTATQDGSRYGATFSIHEHTAQDAAMRGAWTFIELAEKAGLPDWPITRLEVLTFEEHDADLARPLMPELVGVAELAELLDVSKARASELARKPPAGFPAPVARLRSGPVWTKPSLAHFAETWERKSGRPSKPPEE